jgi:four helix bundle protein
MTDRKYDLEERLISFSVLLIKLAEKFPKSFSGNYLAGQLTRSGTSPALHYGEAQSAESRSDFIHKMKIALKELRETNICLKIIDKLHWFEQGTLTDVLRECNELVSIFVKSISTAEKNRQERTPK